MERFFAQLSVLMTCTPRGKTSQFFVPLLHSPPPLRRWPARLSVWGTLCVGYYEPAYSARVMNPMANIVKINPIQAKRRARRPSPVAARCLSAGRSPPSPMPSNATAMAIQTSR